MNAFDIADEKDYDKDCGCNCCAGCGLWRQAEAENKALKDALNASLYEMVTLVARVNSSTAANLQACIDKAKKALK